MTEILLPDNNLAGTLPQTLSNIDWLKVLNLSSNKLSGEFPKCIVKATNLEIVDLSNNNLTGSIPGEISKLIYLRSLNLKRNKINGEIPRTISRCVQLRMLNIGENQVSGTIPDVLSALKNLTVLNLQKNAFTGAIPPSLGLMYKLEILNFEYNQLTGDIPAAITTMIKLRQLVLRYNNLSGVIPERMENLLDLEVLYIDHNQLTGPIPKRFGYLYKCRRINLSNNRLSGGLPESLNEKDLAIVKECNLSNNNLSGELSAGFVSMILHTRAQGIKTFDLTGNNKGFTLPKGIATLKMGVPLAGTSAISDGAAITNTTTNTTTNVGTTSQTNFTATTTTTTTTATGTSTSTKVSNIDLSNLSLGGNFDDRLLSFFESNGFSGTGGGSSINLENNFLCGELSLKIVRFIALSRQQGRKIYLSGNKGFTLPSTLGQLNQELKVLDLSSCSLKKTIPHSIDQFSKGCDINLSNNQLSGELPLGVIKLISKLKSTQISFLDSLAGLCNPGGYGTPGAGRKVKLENNLGFTLPRDMQPIGNDIEELDLSNCCIGGTLSESLTHILDAKRIILDGNNFSSSMTVHIAEYICAMRERGGIFSIKNGGKISLPLDIGRLKTKGPVDLSDLSLWGTIPVSINLLEDRNFISLENNNLSGEMPFGMVKMILKMRMKGSTIRLNKAGQLILPEDLSLLPKYIIQEQNKLPKEESKLGDDYSSGADMEMISPKKGLCVIDLSYCSLTGQLPASICELNKLSQPFNLVFTGNYFTGIIPLSLVRLTHLNSMTMDFEEQNDSSLIDYPNLLTLIIRDLSIGTYDAFFSAVETEVMTDPCKILWKSILASTFTALEEKVRRVAGKYRDKALKAKDDFGKNCLDVATANMRLACTTGLYYCWRYEVNTDQPLHTSENCIVLEAIDRNYENQLRSYYNHNLCEENQLHNYDVAEALVSINLIDKDSVNKLQQIPSNNEVSEDNFIYLCQRFIASNFAVELVPKVALKFVKSNESFTRELMVRSSNAFDGKYVVGFIKDIDERALVDAIEYFPPFQLAQYKAFHHVLVMQKTGSNLSDFLNIEKLIVSQNCTDHDRTVKLFEQLGQCLQHVHEQGVVHGNVSLFNTLCQNGSDWVSDGNDSAALIDFSNSCRFAPKKNSMAGSFVIECFGGRINSTMYLPPEAYYMLDPKAKGKDERAYMAYWKDDPAWNAELMGAVRGSTKMKSSWLPRVFAVEAVNMDGSLIPRNLNGLPYTLLPASPAQDIWAFGMILLNTFADGEKRVSQIIKSRASTKTPLNPWPFWSDQDIDAMLDGLSTTPVLADLLKSIFKSDPSSRFQSMTEVLKHKYFTAVLDRIAPNKKTTTGASLYEVINNKRKKANEQSVAVDGIPGEKFKRLLEVEKILRKSVYSSSFDFSTPTCVVILNRKLDKNVGVPGDAFLWKNVEWATKIAVILKAIKELGTLPYYFDEDNGLSIVVDNMSPEQEKDIAAKYEAVKHAVKDLISEDTEFWLYTVDEVTMDILPEQDDVGSPIRVTPVDIVLRIFPLFHLSLLAIATSRGVEGIAKVLRIPCSQVMGALSVEPCVVDICKFFVNDHHYEQDVLDADNKIQKEYDLLCKTGNSSNALLNNVWKARMAPLNELDLLYAKSDVSFDGLRRATLSTGGNNFTAIFGMGGDAKQNCNIFSRLSEAELASADKFASAPVFTIGNAFVAGGDVNFSKNDYDYTEERSKSRAARSEIAELDEDHKDNGISNEEFLNILKEGIAVTLYSLQEEKPPKQVKLKLRIDENTTEATITWKDLGANAFKQSLTKKSLQLKNLQAVEWGKTTPPFERALDVSDDDCFSLIFVERSLDIRVVNKKERNKVAKGFSKLMNSTYEDDPNSGFIKNVSTSANESRSRSNRAKGIKETAVLTKPAVIKEPADTEYNRIPSDFLNYMAKFENVGSSGKQHVNNLCDDGTEFWNKWCTGSDGDERTDHPTITILLEEPLPVHRYSLRSANDCLEKMPKSWALYGIREGSCDFELLHRIDNEIFDAYWQTKHYVLDSKFENVLFDKLELRISENQKPGSGVQLGMFYLSQSKYHKIGDIKTVTMNDGNVIQPRGSMEVANQPGSASGAGKGGGFGWAQKTSQVQQQDDALRAGQAPSHSPKSGGDDIASWFGFGSKSDEQKPTVDSSSPADATQHQTQTQAQQDPSELYVNDPVASEEPRVSETSQSQSEHIVWRPESRKSSVYDRMADKRTYEDGEVDKLAAQAHETHWTKRFLRGNKEMKANRKSYLQEDPDSHSHLEKHVQHIHIVADPHVMPIPSSASNGTSKLPKESYLSTIGNGSDNPRVSPTSNNDTNNVKSSQQDYANVMNGNTAYDAATERDSEGNTVYEGEVYEHEIDGKNYFVSGEIEGKIYQWISEEEVGEEIGRFENSKPVWY